MSSLNFEDLEKMLDEFNAMYSDQKMKLTTELISSKGLGERKCVLDEFFGRIEEEANFIRNS